jgi:hypothetical protein
LAASPTPLFVLAANGGSSSVGFAFFNGFHLVVDIVDGVPAVGPRAAYALRAIRARLTEHKHCIAKQGRDRA